MPDDLALAAEFDAATREQWRELVAGVLRKAGREDLPDPVEDALRRTGRRPASRVAPLYTAEDAGDLPRAVGVPGLAPFVRGARAGRRPGGGVPGGWDVRQRHAHPDVAVTKEAIAADLENGVTSLWLVLGEGAIPVDALGDVLSDVLLDLAPVTVAGRPAGRRGVPRAGRGPHRPGAAAAPRASTRSAVQAAHRASAGPRPAWPTSPAGPPPTRVCARSSSTRTVFHDAGASAVEELGCSLAAGVAYLRALTEAGLSVDEAFGAAGVPLRARPPTSSPPSPSCGPPAGCGTGSARSAARRPRRAASGSTRSPRR